MNFGAFSKVTQTLNKGLNDVKQFATEKLVQIDPDCVTELPPNYVALESKLDQVKELYETFLRLSRNFTVSDYDPSVSESVKDVVGKLNEFIVKPAQQQLHVPVSPPVSEEEKIPKTFAHALARASSHSALTLGENEPLGAACRKYSAAQQTMGDSRLKMEADVVAKFVQPWSSTLNMNIQFAFKARKQVQTAKMALDSSKMRLKQSKPERLGQSQVEMQEAEEVYNAALSDALHKMRLVVDSPEPLRNLSDLVTAQMNYHSACFETLKALAPDMEELFATQQALFRSN